MATKAEFEQAAAEEPRDAEVIVVLEALIARLLLAEAIIEPSWQGFESVDIKAARKLVARLKGAK